ncbi:ADP-ribosylglycohydrolase family protein [Lacipirellula parvula]|uniref:ADP-ribosylglycohydrolase n=1 Tax=Lacipirellula parvula TaxID=2650471 RepID=A0A5K7XFH1_9BACT|nr:ADP-ribosylglycohydrolase family protein [Lacipirellula parvula]BBO35614.1 ADP-ribosylglycohydrolase [Lacipirellula parvula]
MDRYSHILGCILGAAVGDAAGLRREGLSRRRAARLYGVDAVRPELIFGKGFCSDDTEHTLLAAYSLARTGCQPQEFEREFAQQLKRWIATAPVGVGFATLKACLRLLVGFGPAHSGVRSAGNGPAMRSAILGVVASSTEALIALNRCSTRLTHTDPRAEEGALLVARAARLTIDGNQQTPLELLHAASQDATGDELRRRIANAVAALERGESPQEFADSQDWIGGVTGYVNQSVPAALYCWASSPTDMRACVTNAVLLGGDTDSVASIAGAICGANIGVEGVPGDWVARLSEWPRTTEWMATLARSLDEAAASHSPAQTPSLRWTATLGRNLVVAAVVIELALRRLLPPY